MISRRSAMVFLLVVLVLGACLALYMKWPRSPHQVANRPEPVADRSVTLEVLELRPDAPPEGRVSWRSSPGASPGTVVRIRGHPFVHNREEVTVSIGKHRCPVMKRDEYAVVCMVPLIDPGPSTVTITTPGSEVSHPIDVQPILRLDGTAGDVTRRFLDEVESLLAQSRQDLEHSAIRAVTGRPEYPVGTAPTGGVVQQIVFLIDVSDSMKESDLGPSRLDLAKKTITDLLRQTVDTAETVSTTSQGMVLQYRVGVTPFADKGLTEKYGVPPTADLDKVARVVNALSTRPNTYIGKGLKEAAQQLGKDGGIIVLLSDGKDHSGRNSPDHPLRILGNIKEQGNIVIHTIGIGAPGQEEFDESLLQKLSQRTGGDYYHASSPDKLRQAYHRVLLQAFSQNIIANTLINTLADTHQAPLKENSKRGLAERHTLEQAVEQDTLEQALAALGRQEPSLRRLAWTSCAILMASFTHRTRSTRL
jgi:Mg-chelatase subunit ChlD